MSDPTPHTDKDSDLVVVNKHGRIEIPNHKDPERAKKTGKTPIKTQTDKSVNDKKLVGLEKDSDLIAVSQHKIIDFKNDAVDESGNSHKKAKIKKPKQHMTYKTSEQTNLTGEKNSDLIAVTTDKILDIKNNASVEQTSGKGNKLFGKLFKKHRFYVKSPRQVAVERFVYRALQIFAIIAIVNFFAFLCKPMIDKIIKHVMQFDGFSRLELTLRYGFLWGIIILLLSIPMLSLGYREARKKDRVELLKSIGLFLMVDSFYVMVAVLFMRFIITNAFFGIFTIQYLYISAFLTRGTNFLEIYRGYELWNMISVAVTFQIVMLPSFLFFLFGYKKRIVDRENAKSGKAKSRSIFVIDPTAEKQKSSTRRRSSSANGSSELKKGSTLLDFESEAGKPSHHHHSHKSEKSSSNKIFVIDIDSDANKSPEYRREHHRRKK